MALMPYLQQDMGVEFAVAPSPTAFCVASPGVVTPVFPLSVHASGRYLVTASGTKRRLKTVFLWQAWTTLSLAEFNTYLTDIRNKGFNGFEAWLLDGFSTTGTNSRGDAPFTTAGDLSTPNDNYFDFVEQFLAAASAQGMAVLLYYTYTGYNGTAWWGVVSSNSLANCQSWAAYLGARLKKYSNVVLMSGGDFSLPNDANRPKYVAILTGLRTAGCTQIAGSEWGEPDTLVIDQGGYTYGVDLSSDHQLGSAYCEGPKEGGSTGNGRTYDTMDRAVRTMRLPAFPCETPQVDGTYYPIDMSRASCRKYWHWAVTAGGIAGLNVGQTNVANPTNSADLFNHWQDPCFFDAKYANDLYDSLDWSAMRPSGTPSSSPHTRSGATGSTYYCGRVLVVSGGGSGDTLMTSCMADGGNQLLVYVPPDLPASTSQKTFQVDCRSLVGTRNARWWNPTSGAFTAATPSTVNNSLSAQSFTTPGDNGTGTNDWMLVIS